MANRRHGYYGTPTYKSRGEMIYRCKTKGTLYYKKGITVCGDWTKFDNFLKDMGDRPSKLYSIDRINNDGNYNKGNCRWATKKQQAGNRGNTLLLKGKTLSEWSGILGVKRSTLAQRHYVYGWDNNKVLSYNNKYFGK